MEAERTFSHHRNSVLTSTVSFATVGSDRLPATIVSGGRDFIGTGGVGGTHLEPWVLCCGLDESAFAWGENILLDIVSAKFTAYIARSITTTHRFHLDMEVVHEILLMRLLHLETVTVHITFYCGVINPKFLRNKQVIYVHTAPFTGLSGITLYKRNGRRLYAEAHRRLRQELLRSPRRGQPSSWVSSLCFSEKWKAWNCYVLNVLTAQPRLEQCAVKRGEVIIPVCFMLLTVFTLIPLYPVFLSYSNGESQRADLSVSLRVLCIFGHRSWKAPLPEISWRFPHELL